MTSNYELCVVIPAYNEASNIVLLIEDWHRALTALQINYQFIIIDDGSRDNTADLIKDLQTSIPTINLYTQSNAGHGPAILNGYEKGLPASWILQIDSDHQFETDTFSELWQQRHQYDLLLAERAGKNATYSRDVVSLVSKLLIVLLYGGGVNDVNSPYRLMRTRELKAALSKVPSNAFAPNVLITAYFIWGKKRIFRNTVQHRKNVVLRKSGMNSYFFKGCINSFLQVIKFRFSI